MAWDVKEATGLNIGYSLALSIILGSQRELY